MDTQLDDYIPSQQPDDMHFLTPRMQGSQSNNMTFRLMIMIMRESQSRFLPRSTQRVPAKILPKIPRYNNGKITINIPPPPAPKTLVKSPTRNFVKIPTKILVRNPS